MVQTGIDRQVGYFNQLLLAMSIEMSIMARTAAPSRGPKAVGNAGKPPVVNICMQFACNFTARQLLDLEPGDESL